METEFTTPSGIITLKRFPENKRELLRAWNTADEYLLNHAMEPDNVARIGFSHCLTVNDQFGALSLGINTEKVTCWSDSKIAFDNIEKNAQLNQQNISHLNLVPSTETPQGCFDLVLIQIPKNLSLLEYQLHQIQPLLAENALILSGGMIKHLPKSAIELVANILGETTAQLAWKKARVFNTRVETKINSARESSTYQYRSYFKLEKTPFTIVNHPNVFSRQSLDIGTRLFLQNIPQGDYQHIIDLGCGNGVVGLMAAQKNPDAKVTCTDESYLATQSAKETFTAAEEQGVTNSTAFLTQDCLTDTSGDTADLILCNPPFHQQQTVGDHITRRMFAQSKAALRQKGELWIVGNRHLGYHVQLKRLFGNCRTVASNKKFVILKAVKR